MIAMTTSTIVLAGLLAQMPNPGPALDAAKNAKAQTEAAQQKNADALAPSTGPGQGPQKPAEQPPPPGGAPAQGAGAAPGGSYSYEPGTRRDPFISLLGRGGDPTPSGVRAQGLAGILIGEVTVKGVMKTTRGEFVALLQAPDTRTYIAKSGDKVMDGAVKTITAAEVVFTQDVTDPLSLVKQREVRKTIRPEAR
jgi:hypothetical protein